MGGITRPAELTDETRPARRDRLGEYGGVEVGGAQVTRALPANFDQISVKTPTVASRFTRYVRYNRYDRYDRYVRYVR